jgi:hypothetical protein
MLGAVRCAVAEDGSHWRVYQATSPGTAGPPGMNRTRDHMAVAGRAGHRLDRPRAATADPVAVPGTPAHDGDLEFVVSQVSTPASWLCGTPMTIGKNS